MNIIGKDSPQVQGLNVSDTMQPLTDYEENRSFENDLLNEYLELNEPPITTDAQLSNIPSTSSSNGSINMAPTSTATPSSAPVIFISSLLKIFLLAKTKDPVG